MIILIRNIDRSITEEEVRKLLETHGKVRTFDLVMDKATGKSKGFGFADMPDIEQAAKMIEKLDGFQLGSEKLRVKRAAVSSLLKPGQDRPKVQERKEFWARKNAKKAARKSASGFAKKSPFPKKNARPRRDDRAGDR